MFGQRTLTQILGGFRQTLQDLEALSAHNAVKIESNNAVIGELSGLNLKLHQECGKADKVAANIRQLLEE